MVFGYLSLFWNNVTFLRLFIKKCSMPHAGSDVMEAFQVSLLKSKLCMMSRQYESTPPRLDITYSNQSMDILLK